MRTVELKSRGKRLNDLENIFKKKHSNVSGVVIHWKLVQNNENSWNDRKDMKSAPIQLGRVGFSRWQLLLCVSFYIEIISECCLLSIKEMEFKLNLPKTHVVFIPPRNCPHISHDPKFLQPAPNSRWHKSSNETKLAEHPLSITWPPGKQINKLLSMHSKRIKRDTDKQKGQRINKQEVVRH